MNDTTRRFLNSVLLRVPESRIVELRLFPAMRQGGIESGVAVLAVESGFDTPAEAPAPVIDVVLDEVLEEPGEVMGEREVLMAPELADEAEAAEGLVDTRETSDAEVRADVSLSEIVLDELERETARDVARDGVEEEEAALAADFSGPSEEVILAEADVIIADAAPDEAEETIALGDILALPSPDVVAEAPHTGPSRLAILCARYKLVFKGPDRGKFDLEIMHQADAPLETLDRVISGVMRRSGEEAEPARYDARSLRAALDAPVWAEAS